MLKHKSKSAHGSWEDDSHAQERWLISYADLMTLLFAFFVVMYATSTINLNKYRKLSTAVGTAFSGQGQSLRGISGSAEVNQASTATTPNDSAPNSATSPRNDTTVMKPLPLSYLYQERRQRQQEKLAQLAQQLVNDYAHSAALENQQLSVYVTPRGVRLELQDPLLFQPESASLAQPALTVLRPLLARLHAEPCLIEIEGHDERLQLAGQQGKWASSALKAAQVAQALMQAGIPAARLKVSGQADTQPLSSSDTQMATRLNRRITLWLTFATATEQANEQALMPDASAESPTLINPNLKNTNLKNPSLEDPSVEKPSLKNPSQPAA